MSADSILRPLFFSHTSDPDELAVECAAQGYHVLVLQDDTTRPGYGYVVRQRGTGAYFIREATSGAVYLVRPADAPVGPPAAQGSEHGSCPRCGWTP